MSRYEGKPLLRLIECYVLDAIGELQADDEATLDDLTPKLQSAYGSAGTWREIIAQVMHFPPDMDDQLRALWAHNRNLAAENGEELLPEDFARLVADENFVDENA